MPTPKNTLKRRDLLRYIGLLPTSAAATVTWAQTSSQAVPARHVSVAQIVDFSQAQQDVSKDFLIGSRAAWADINNRGGLRGKRVEHWVLETDGNTSSLDKALAAVKDNPACLALFGTVGDRLASQTVTSSRQLGLNMAHAAPWLQDGSLDIGDKTFPIFAARQEQIAYALKSAAVMGIREMGVVYASALDFNTYHTELDQIALNQKIKLLTFRATQELRQLGQTLSPATPALLLFIGGTPELAEFTQGLQQQNRQRYVLALADINLNTLRQLGKTRHTSVIATQPVPMVNTSLPIARNFRDTLARLFDEQPTALSLAGFIAARYTFEVLNNVDGALTRQSTLTAFQQRASLDLGGFLVNFNTQRRSTTYVTQSMMSADGRLIG
jgi:ABC-type branched-subunit amino acid transport system substrate-binding protein